MPKGSARNGARITTALRPPPFQPVQLATLVDLVPAGDRWLHEMKYDGYRLLVAVGGGTARAYTRSGLDWSEKFAGICDAAAGLEVGSALLDGEAVVMDENGRSSFQGLQGALKGDPAAIDFVAFDLLELNGDDLKGLPLTQRKAKLRSILPDGDARIRYSEHIEGNGEKLLHSFCDAGLEGVISKKADGRYIGSRSGGWLKAKCIKRQEFVVVGWTPSDKSRLFRSLILAVHEDGVLRYAGKVGTGFSNDEIMRLMETMRPLAQDAPTVKAPRAEVRGAHWLKPKLVAEIAYTEMTNEGSRIRRLASETPAQLMLFDCLALDGSPLVKRPLSERRVALERFHATNGTASLLLSPRAPNLAGAQAWLAASGSALDGVIAKSLDQTYRPGERAMLKVKQHRTADCVVGGFRRAKDRPLVASLLLGLYDDTGLLNHVGFTSALARQDRAQLTESLEKLISPPGFTGKAPGGPSRWNDGKESEWFPLNPELVVEVSFDQVTSDRFRHGTGLVRWRPDKAPRQCRMEQLDFALRPSDLADIS